MRLRIAVTCIKQAFDYIKRLESLKNSNQVILAGNPFVKHEEYLSLPWFKRLRELQEELGMNRSLVAVKALSYIGNKFKRLGNLAMPLNVKAHLFC